MPQSKEEKRAYQRGYNAGKKWSEKESARIGKLHEEISGTYHSAARANFNQLYVQIFSSLLASKKRVVVDNKPAQEPKDYSTMALVLTKEGVTHMKLP